jgi:hypothetical protein
MHIIVRRVLALSAAAGLLSDAACFSYVPMTAGTAPVGADVRVSLNTAGTTELARFLGPHVIAVDGAVSSISSNGAMLIPPQWVQLDGGSRQRWTGEEAVAFPQGYITGIQLRTLDRRRSTIAAVLIGASVVTIGTILMRGSGSSASAPEQPGSGVFVRR